MPMPIAQPDPTDEIDHALMAQATLDDAHAWRIIERRVWGRVVFVLGTQSPDVDDVVQDACIKIQTALQSGLGPRTVGASAGAWVVTIAMNTAIDHLRQQKRWGTVYSHVGDLAEFDEEAVTEASIELEDVVSLESALLALCDAHRLVMIMLHRDRYTCSEVARRLGIPENTVKSRAARALGKLREFLQDADDIEAQIGRFRP
jgi:RNA polymerase sigma-70 factor (ECF subfamily)